MPGSRSSPRSYRRGRAPERPVPASVAGPETPPPAPEAAAPDPIPAPPFALAEGLPAEDLIISELLAPQGLKGLVRGLTLTDFPEDLNRLDEVIVEHRGQRGMMPTRSIKVHGRFLLFEFVGIDTVEVAEAMRGAVVKIPRDKAHTLGPGEYYVSDIVGLEVFTEEGRSLGKIQDVRRTGSNDVYYAERALVPATREAVLNIDVPGGRMVVREELVVED